MHSESFFELIGTIGSLIICASALPQIIKTCRSKKAGDLSILYLTSLMLGAVFVEGYSIYRMDFVFILSNSLTIIMTGILIVLWIAYGLK
jgi:MtN3 and saliva related transmembrane protein